ncbi:MAG: undecaprenyldiphospho-muramoylpentapeptide beta-N-acetylglucosaminyltransferase [Verrucomicrobiota bacterium]
MPSPSRLLIACGGTGGHLFPGIAVAETWRDRGGEVLLLISEKQIDALATEGYDHLEFMQLPAVAMPPLLSLKLPGFVLCLGGQILTCRKLIRNFRADAVLGMGGFTSTAPLVAGSLAGKPTFIHESNAIPGRANKLNARFCQSALVGFEECAPFFKNAKGVEVVGTPLRPAVVKKPSRGDARARFGLRGDRRTLLVMGGSQGARRINELIAASLPAFASEWMQVLHICGPRDFELIKPAYDEHPEAGVLLDFCSDIENAYAAADLALCRSGAASSTELAYYEKPAVLIPYPFAADDHQTANARIFSKPGAAELWVQDELSDETFTKRILQLIDDEDRLKKMSSAMGALAVPDASARVCDVIAASLVRQ